MKNFLISCFFFLFIVSVAIGQVNNKKDKVEKADQTKKEKIRPKNKKQDFIIINLNWNWWFNQPENMQVSPFSRGVEAYLMYDIPIKKTPIAFAIGLGVSTENIFCNAFLRDSADGQSVYFDPIQPIVNPEDPQTGTRGWKKYKLGTTIIELPVEFRFRLKPYRRNTFKIALGGKVGYVVATKDKYKGPDYKDGVNSIDDQIKYKTYGLPGISRLRYAAYIRIGYGRIHATAAYTFAPFFKDGVGIVQNVTPFSVGISVTPF